MNKTLPTEVTMTEFRDNLSAYLDAAENGKTITITRRGRPSATLAAAREIANAIDLGALRAFRESLGVRTDESVIVRARQDGRY
jgi:prevent-host-death family protein